MANYRYLAYDLVTNTALGDLPLGDVSYSFALNAPGAFKATLPADPAQAAIINAATIPERTIIYIERDGVLRGAYIVWVRDRNGLGPGSLNGASVESFLFRNRIVANLTYTATDQLVIARNIITHLQSQTGGNIGITLDATTSGVTRDRTYYGYERKNVGDAITELANVNNGFDFAVDVAYVADVPTKTLNLSYPRRGRIAGSTGIVFETGKNIIDYTFREDGTRSARAVDAFGAGDGTDMKISTQQRVDLIAAGYPLTAEQVSFKDVIVQATLDAHSLAAVNARAATPIFLTLTVDPDDVDGGIGTWVVGDDALVRLSNDNFPVQADGTPGYVGYHRIVAATVNVPDAGKETVDIVCGNIAA